MTTPVLKARVFHLSTLQAAPVARFRHDVRLALSERPDWLSLTEVRKRRPAIRELLDGTGYRAVFFDSGETAFIYDFAGGVRLTDTSETKAHDAGKDYPARFLTRADFTKSGEEFAAFTGHWLAHLNDSKARLNDHNAMTDLCAAQMREAAKGKVMSVLGCDANEDDRPGEREDKALGNMTARFREAGITTCWDEVGRHPDTFGKRTIDLIATVDADSRAEVLSTVVLDVKGDHDLVGAVLGIGKRRRGA